MDPDDWQQPQQFRPERFLDQSGNVIGRHRVVAFSLGIRQLIPYSRFVLNAVISLLRNCRQTVTAGDTVTLAGYTSLSPL